ncbi:uncharacterized protein L203_104516 [Cryptococcus depauperatus CBS 7841]|uniref:Uncharacterized protein n=1 Tax=Cryptococcus depauperatus CBS 7841 TaxID=1295531 RepID=A0A1E3ILV5_9TREE|nr:signal recognition particle subunit SRP19 [Cryptococcus depauperatus CBS 7841]
MPTVEDYFDDETDFPLPSSSKTALPHTGIRGALIEEITDENDFDLEKLVEQGRGIFGEDARAPPATSGSALDKGKLAMKDEEMRPNGSGPQVNSDTPMGGFMGDMMKLQAVEEERLERLRKQFGNATFSGDPGICKEWNSVYPLYFDAKVSINAGRRVPRALSVWWPLASHIAQACKALDLPVVLEADRYHPANWENPGRSKVQIIKDGKYVNPVIRNRTQLYKHLADQIRQQNPSIAFDPHAIPLQRHKPNAVATSKTKNSKSLSKNLKTKGKVTHHFINLPTRPPLPPQPIPALDDRLPLHSPAVSAGVAVAAIKREKETEKERKKGVIEGGKATSGKAPKMKRMVVRGKR